MQKAIYTIPAFFLIFFIASIPVYAQVSWASHVHDYQFGSGQNTGQGTTQFPANVIGEIRNTITETVPESDPQYVVSLGRNGWVVLGFETPIIDIQGPDFVVFENAFRYGPNAEYIFDEWMTVSVSEDGIHWIDFPYDSLTGAGMAGKTPSVGVHALIGDLTQCGGDAFDLATVGLSSAMYVKVTDATRFQTADKLGAELDGIMKLNTTSTTIETATSQLPFTVNTSVETLILTSPHNLEISLYSSDGALIFTQNLLAETPQSFASFTLSTGLYLWVWEEKGKRKAAKWMNFRQ